MRAQLAALGLLAGCVGLTGCSTVISRPPLPDVATRPPDVITAPPLQLPPDPVPQAEPRSRYGNPATYEVFGRRYAVLTDARGYRERGTASWYGPGFHGERTSSGEPYDMYGMTAAHKTLPLPVYVRVENLANGRAVVVRVNDRGPFVGDRIIDLSYSAAAKLDMLRGGTAPVEISVIEPGNSGEPAAGAPRVLVASPPPPERPVTTPAPAPALAPVPVLAGSQAGRYVQAGAFGTRENALRLADRLRNAGFSAIELQTVTGANGAPLTRVSIGPVTSSAEADDVIERLALAGVADARLVHPLTLQ